MIICSVNNIEEMRMNVGRQSWQLNPDANGEELALEVLMDVFSMFFFSFGKSSAIHYGIETYVKSSYDLNELHICREQQLQENFINRIAGAHHL